MRIKKTNSFEGGSNLSDRSNNSKGSEGRGSKLPKQFTSQIRNNNIMTKKSSVKVKEILKAAMSTFVCGICQMNVDREDTKVINSEDCGHRFCTECFTQYAIYKVNVSEEVLCPEEGCQAKMDERSELFLSLPEQIREKWKQQQIWRQTINNPDIKICPNQDCREGIVDLKKEPPECRKCHRKYCQECMMEAHEGPCDKNFQGHFREWKRCPRCRIFIQKDEGCNHMTCNCGHQFCFVCFADWESSHYDCIEGLQNRMCFNDQEEIDSCTARLIFPFFLLLFPLIIVFGIIAIALAIGCGAALGIIISPCLVCKQFGFVCCGICALILLPFAAVFAAFAVPAVIITTAFRPQMIRIMTQYCNTVSFLKDNL